MISIDWVYRINRYNDREFMLQDADSDGAWDYFRMGGTSHTGAHYDYIDFYDTNSDGIWDRYVSGWEHMNSDAPDFTAAIKDISGLNLAVPAVLEEAEDDHYVAPMKEVIERATHGLVVRLALDYHSGNVSWKHLIDARELLGTSANPTPLPADVVFGLNGNDGMWDAVRFSVRARGDYWKTITWDIEDLGLSQYRVATAEDDNPYRTADGRVSNFEFVLDPEWRAELTTPSRIRIGRDGNLRGAIIEDADLDGTWDTYTDTLRPLWPRPDDLEPPSSLGWFQASHWRRRPLYGPVQFFEKDISNLGIEVSGLEFLQSYDQGVFDAFEWSTSRDFEGIYPIEQFFRSSENGDTLFSYLPVRDAFRYVDSVFDNDQFSGGVFSTGYEFDDAAATGHVTIDGSPRVGEVLTANTEAVADPVNGLNAPGYRYRWEWAPSDRSSGGEPIAGATQAAYTPVLADEGKFLRVTVVFTDDDGYPEIKTSKWTAVAAVSMPAVGDVTTDDPPPAADVAPPDDAAATGDVTIDGPPQVGETLAANTAAIADPVNGLSAPGYRYQWERADDAGGTNAEQIAGATQAAYTPTAADEGKFLRVTVAFTDDDGYAETKTSEWTAATAPMPAVGEVTVDALPQTAPAQPGDAAPPSANPAPAQQPKGINASPDIFATDVFATYEESYRHKSTVLTFSDQNRDGALDRIEFDRDRDGTADRIQSYVWNDAGGAVRIDYDLDADGTADRIMSYVWNDAGGVIQIDVDYDADGAADRIVYCARGSRGHVVRVDVDQNADGVVDWSDTYERDANDVVTRIHHDLGADGRIDRTLYDDDGDGRLDRTETYTHDAQGHLNKKVTVVGSEDEGDAGDVPVEEPEVEDAGGVNLGLSVGPVLPDMGKGAVVRSETYTRNAAGAVVRTDYDEGDDGMSERSSFDDAGDGVVDRTETYARNAAGAVVRTEVERDDDALVDEYRYDHDADGRFDWVGRDNDNDGMIDRLEFHGQWGAADNLVTHSITLSGAGPAYAVAFHDGDGLQLASGWSVAGPSALGGFAYSTDLAVVSELQTAASTGSAAALFPVDATLLAGVAHIDLAGAGAGSTDLTLSATALAVLADGDGSYLLRIDGDGDDILRFDLDDFTRRDDVAVDGENYEQYAGATGNFIVDPDVTLVDV